MTDLGPAKPLKPCEHVRKLQQSPEQYGRGLHSLAYAVGRYESELADAWQKDQAIHAENEAAIAHNKAMRDRIAAIMKAAGIADSYRDRDTRSRSMYPKHKTHPAGYIGDLARAFPIGDGFEMAKQAYESRAKVLADAKVKVLQEKAAAEQQAAAGKAKRKADLALAGIIIRYQLAEDTDWGDALDALRKRDKYLDLAVAGSQTRGDWSEGFYRVEHALGRFTIETDRDKDIAADLCGCLRARDDGENDGRVFRDTTWSYGKLFDLIADKQLLADARTCMENAE